MSEQYSIEWERQLITATPRIVMPVRTRVLTPYQLILRQLGTDGETYQAPLEENVNAPQPRKASARKARQKRAAYGPKSKFDSLHTA